MVQEVFVKLCTYTHVKQHSRDSANKWTHTVSERYFRLVQHPPSYRIICVLVKIKVRRHLVMSIIQFMNVISVHFWAKVALFDYFLWLKDKLNSAH